MLFITLDIHRAVPIGASLRAWRRADLSPVGALRKAPW